MEISEREWKQIHSAKAYVDHCLGKINPEEVADHGDLLMAAEVLCAAVSELQFVAEDMAYLAEPVDAEDDDMGVPPI